MKIIVTNHIGALLVTFLLFQFSYSQLTVTGEEDAVVGEEHEYRLSSSIANIGTPSWTVDNANATILNITNPYRVRIRFNRPGSVRITVNAQNFDSPFTDFLTKGFTVSIEGPQTPPTPTPETNACGAASIRSYPSQGQGPDTGYRWYWQGKSSASTTRNLGDARVFPLNQGSGTYYLRTYHEPSGTWSAEASSIPVNIEQFEPGTIEWDGPDPTPTICYNGDPPFLVSDVHASGTSSSGTSYMWQYANSSNGPWVDTDGTSQFNYNTPAGLTADRWYRRKVTSCGGQVKYSNVLFVDVRPALTGGSINGVQTICYNQDPGNLGNTANPTNGQGGYAYQWEVSANNSDWSEVSGARGSSYNPSTNLTADRWYRRRVESCGQTAYSSNTVKVTVRAQLAPGTTGGNQQVCYGGNPSAITSTSGASNGNNYDYHWEVSTNNSIFNEINGATSLSYTPPGNATADRWYRRRVESCGQTRYTTPVKIDVRPSLQAGSIGGTQSICHGEDPGNLGNATSPSGGDGNYGYRWQVSPDNSDWSYISSATAGSYNPSTNLTADRWYRREVKSCGQTRYTSSVKVTVIPPLGIPTGASTFEGCNFGNLDIFLTPASGGNTVRWYTTATGGSHIDQGTLNLTNLSVGSVYYASTYSSSVGCESTSRKQVTITQASASSCEAPDAGDQDTFISGDTNMFVGDERTYVMSPPSTLTDIKWTVPSANGEIINMSASDYQITVRFTAPGQFPIEVRGMVSGGTGGTSFSSSSLQVFVDGPKIPNTPGIEQNACGELIFKHSGDPPQGVLWYWQGQNPNSTSKALGFASPFPANDGPGTYYLRAYHVESETWSQEASFRTVNSIAEFGPGTIDFASGQASTICYAGDPPDLSNVTLAPGRINSETSYSWEYSDTGTNGPWQATGGTSSIFEETPAGLTADRWYRRKVTSCSGQSLFSNVLKVTVLDELAVPQGQTTYALCAEDTVSIELTVGAGNTVLWYANSTTNNNFAEGIFSAAGIHIGNTYYASAYNNATGCSSARIPIQIALASPESCTVPDNDPIDLGEDPDISLTISGDNYVYNRAYQTPEDNATSFFTVNDNLIQDITYVDGVGRAQQQLGMDHSPDKADIVTHMEYDGFGRQVKEYLPYVSSQGSLGSLKTGNVTGIENWYDTPKYENTQNPYSEKEFEESPLNRVFQQAAPGNDWALGNGHEIGFGYRANTADDDVRFFDITTVTDTNNGVITYRGSLVDGGRYIKGELSKIITYDENNNSGLDHSSEAFSNKQGQVILKRTYADVTNEDGSVSVAEPHDTYYVYDDFGNLSYVLPPKMEGTTASLSQLNANMAALGYQYVYDHRNRLVEKTVPGKGIEYIVYNILDQPIMTQDANMQAKGEWLFTKYDAFGRVTYTGMVDSNKTRLQVQQEANNSNTLWESPNGGTNRVDSQQVNYTNGSYPNSDLKELHTVNYYDSYDTDRNGTPDAGIAATVMAFDTISTVAVQGMPTVSLVKVLGTTDFITTVSYYDDKGRPIYTHMRNPYLNSEDKLETLLDFVGRPLKVRSEHTKDGNTVVTLDNFSYDHVGRLLEQTQCVGDQSLGYDCASATTGGAAANIVFANETINGEQVATNSIILRPVMTLAPGVTLRIDPNASTGGGTGTGIPKELIVRNTYDELGQLDFKEVGGKLSSPGGGAAGGGGLQTVDYEYNVRGWLEGINDSTPHDNVLTLANDRLWGFRIQYNDIADNSRKLFNGNISVTQWKSQSDNTTGNPVSNRYTYDYDALNRITGATDNTDNYNLSNVSYDKNGNILTLNRQGHRNAAMTSFGVMDKLVYAYNANSNRLGAVTDTQDATAKLYGFVDGNVSGDDYGYDANGNMISDANKGITNIEYNFLNLPTEVAINGNGNTGTISYIYDATGVKLEKLVSTGTKTEYCGNYIYENSSLQFFNHAEGYVNANGSGYEYVYQCKDHLGNVRLSYSDSNNDGNIDASTEIIEESNYYPFGLEHKGYNNVVTSTNPAQDYKFQGVELEEALGLNLYEMEFRNYDPTLGRFTGIDPVTHHSMSPYVAFDNNPIFWVDPSGADATDPIKEKNTIITSRVDEHNVTHITQTTTTTTTTTNDDGSVSVSYSSGSITNTVDANGEVTNGSSVTTTTGTVSRDADGNVSASDPTSTTRSASNNDSTSALGEFTGVVSDYNANNNGVYNIDKINKLADNTTRATKAGVAVLGVFGGLDKLTFGKLGPNSKKAFNILGGTTSSDGIVGKAGSLLKNEIGKNNGYMMIYGVEQVRNGVTLKKMKTPSSPDGNRKRVGPTSFQDLWKGIKSIFN